MYTLLVKNSRTRFYNISQNYKPVGYHWQLNHAASDCDMQRLIVKVFISILSRFIFNLVLVKSYKFV